MAWLGTTLGFQKYDQIVVTHARTQRENNPNNAFNVSIHCHIPELSYMCADGLEIASQATDILLVFYWCTQNNKGEISHEKI